MYRCTACGYESENGRHWCEPGQNTLPASGTRSSGPLAWMARWKESRLSPARQVEETWRALGGPIDRETAELMSLAGLLRVDPITDTTICLDGDVDVRDVLRAKPTEELVRLASDYALRVKNPKIATSRAENIAPQHIREALGFDAFLHALLLDELSIRTCLWCGRLGHHLYACAPTGSPKWRRPHPDEDDEWEDEDY